MSTLVFNSFKIETAVSHRMESHRTGEALTAAAADGADGAKL